MVAVSPSPPTPDTLDQPQIHRRRSWRHAPKVGDAPRLAKRKFLTNTREVTKAPRAGTHPRGWERPPPIHQEREKKKRGGGGFPTNPPLFPSIPKKLSAGYGCGGHVSRGFAAQGGAKNLNRILSSVESWGTQALLLIPIVVSSNDVRRVFRRPPAGRVTCVLAIFTMRLFVGFSQGL